jgi:hypothetical protein
MNRYLEELLKALRPAFSRRAAFEWFVIVVAGLLLRGEHYGVSSLVRALLLDPASYPCLLHFFHSTAWSTETLLASWRKWLMREGLAYRLNGRIVLVGDHTKIPKDGRKMPAVTTMHQESETGSKPSYFRGHNWGCLGLLINAGRQFFAAPLWAEIHRDSPVDSQTTYLVRVAGRLAREMRQPAILVLDAFFAARSVFEVAASEGGLLHILTRAKKNVVAYLPPLQPQQKKRGRPKKYGEKLKLQTLFDAWKERFETGQAEVYGRTEMVGHLTLDLLWQPTKNLVRFFLIETSRGRIILMTSDLEMEATAALHLYCRRVTIETLFDVLKNLLGGMGYHFWSQYLRPSSRRPKKNAAEPVSSQPEKTARTLAAIENFLAVQLVVAGVLQLLACRFGSEIQARSRCWLRTPCGEIPSLFVTRHALASLLRRNFRNIANDLITQLIRKKQKEGRKAGNSQEVA